MQHNAEEFSMKVPLASDPFPATYFCSLIAFGCFEFYIGGFMVSPAWALAYVGCSAFLLAFGHVRYFISDGLFQTRSLWILGSSHSIADIDEVVVVENGRIRRGGLRFSMNDGDQKFVRCRRPQQLAAGLQKSRGVHNYGAAREPVL